MYVCMNVCMYVCIYVCMCACVCVCVCVCNFSHLRFLLQNIPELMKKNILSMKMIPATQYRLNG